MFKINPILAIWLTLTWPLAKTIALGGVAIGNIKAQLAAMVIGINSCNSGISIPIAIPAITGARTVTRATLLINSVIKIISNMRSVTMR